MGQEPYVGQIVFQYAYGSPGGEYAAGSARPAIVTKVVRAEPGCLPLLSLFIITENGSFHEKNVEYGPGMGGHWGYGVEG